jgi:hypothetical protein
MQLKAAEPHEGPSPLSHAAVRSQLERTLGSELFRRSERLSAFVRFVTEEALSGRGDVLKEQVLGSELYGKGPEFDGSAEPIVRVRPGRLAQRAAPIGSQLNLSRDGRLALVAQQQLQTDVMLVENFK